VRQAANYCQTVVVAGVPSRRLRMPVEQVQLVTAAAAAGRRITVEGGRIGTTDWIELIEAFIKLPKTLQVTSIMRSASIYTSIMRTTIHVLQSTA